MAPRDPSRPDYEADDTQRSDEQEVSARRPSLVKLFKLGLHSEIGRLGFVASCFVLLVAFVVFLLMTAIGSKIDQGVQRRDASKNEKAQRGAEDAVDAKEPPFTVNVRYITDEEIPRDTGGIVFDEALPLSSIEGDEESLDEIARRYDGKPLVETAYGSGVPVKITFGSSRKGDVSITGLAADIRSCRQSQAKAVVVWYAQGVSEVESANFNLSDDGSPPTGSISTKDIILGEGESPTSLLVVGGAPEGQTCEWTIKATYVDADNNEHTEVIDDSGRPFRSENAPENPEQLFAVDYATGQWVDCISLAGAEQRDTQCLQASDALE
ncbi:hypothetical protein ACXZ65_37165 [Streptomyces aculeolatus]